MMDISNLLENPLLRHNEFPITSSKTFLAHAAVSPFPRRVASAISTYTQRASSEGQWEYIYANMENDTRKYAAALLGASEDEIAFVSSTSMGLSMVASGLSWQQGDNVIIADGDFPSNVYPWLNLKSRGVQIKFIPRNEDGVVTWEDIDKLADKNTRLVSLSTVNYISGFKIDVSSIGSYLHQRNILFCIDAIQSLGAFPIDTTHIDFLAAGANKWLLGPIGIGILYIKRKNLGLLSPTLAGWKCVQSSKSYTSYNLCFLDSAKRFEPACVSVLSLVGLNAALELLLEIKVENIARRLAMLRRIIVPSLKEKGYKVFGFNCPEQISGITSFSSRKQDIVQLRNKLDSSGFVVSLRDGLDGNKCIRVSPHFYNTEEEILQFLAKIPET
jgi:cysteine desulfurase/selenocysteine lyase